MRLGDTLIQLPDLGSYLQEAIVEYIGDLEDFYLAEQRMAAIRAGHAGTISLADVGRDLGLAY